MMNKLKLIIKYEYLNEITSKAFWIATIVTPVIFGLFSLFFGFLAQDSKELQTLANPTAPDPNDLTGIQVAGMLGGIFLALFLMIYGSQIFAKVKKEKTNRVMEVMATCVTGRTMMLGKIISVGLIGLTQLGVWFVMIGGILISMIMAFAFNIPNEFFSDMRVWMGIIWLVLFFLGGYVFYGSLYAACGAMTDKDNENQTYMTIITFLLLGSFYIGMYAVNHASSAFILFCTFLPFTSPTIGAINAVAGTAPLWISILSLISLYVFAWLSLAISGKIYTSSLLLKGRKFTPADIIAFFKSK